MSAAVKGTQSRVATASCASASSRLRCRTSDGRGAPDIRTQRRIHEIADGRLQTRGLSERWRTLPLWRSLLLAAPLARRSMSRRTRQRRPAIWTRQWANYRKAVQACTDNANYKIALQRALASRFARRTSSRRDARPKAGPARSGARRYTPDQRIRPDQPTGNGQGRLSSTGRFANDRGVAAAPADRTTLRAGTRCSRPPPMLNPASRDPHSRCSQQLPSLRDILNAIGGIDRHQHHLRPRRAGPRRHGAARWRHARTGAESADDDEPAVR
mgnify:CR=1 FL=1